MSGDVVERELNRMLESVPGASGVNNHEGSLATTDAKLMAELMPLLKQRDLFFVEDRKSTRLNSSHVAISYAVFCLKKKKEDSKDASPRPPQMNLMRVEQHESIPKTRNGALDHAYHVCARSFAPSSVKRQL